MGYYYLTPMNNCAAISWYVDKMMMMMMMMMMLTPASY